MEALRTWEIIDNIRYVAFVHIQDFQAAFLLEVYFLLLLSNDSMYNICYEQHQVSTLVSKCLLP